MMQVRGRLRCLVAGSCSMPRSRTKSCKTPSTIFAVRLSKPSVGLWMHNTSGFATRARARLSSVCFVSQTTEPHSWTSGTCRASKIDAPSPSRAQMLRTRSRQPSLSPRRTPKVMFSYKLPWKNIASQFTCSTRKCEGTKTMLWLVSCVIMSAISLRSVDLPSPWGPASTTSWPCGMSIEPSNLTGATKFSSLPWRWNAHLRKVKFRLVTLMGSESIGRWSKSLGSNFLRASALMALVSSRRHLFTCIRWSLSVPKFKMVTRRRRAVKHLWMSKQIMWRSDVALPTQPRIKRSAIRWLEISSPSMTCMPPSISRRHTKKMAINGTKLALFWKAC
mmetsp:Transcript_76876/g.195134  ORF Transcript_76876/g.195134 Transcript_76876/m.195134 type:complete len:334 (+) Transcript_76876:308-1309(+)